jgi:hypothetical protein
MRHGPQNQIGPAGIAQRDAFAGQPFEIAMLADVHDRVDAELVAQPEIERQIRMRRHEFRVVITRVVALLA